MMGVWVLTRDLLERLRADKDGIVSFEYIIVVVCVIGAVGAAFNGVAAGNIAAALTSGIGTVATVLTTAIAG